MTKETIIMNVKELEQRQKIARIYQRWQRRSCYGELIQIDGAAHAGLKNEGLAVH